MQQPARFESADDDRTTQAARSADGSDASCGAADAELTPRVHSRSFSPISDCTRNLPNTNRRSSAHSRRFASSLPLVLVAESAAWTLTRTWQMRRWRQRNCLTLPNLSISPLQMTHWLSLRPHQPQWLLSQLNQRRLRLSSHGSPQLSHRPRCKIQRQSIRPLLLPLRL